MARYVERLQELLDEGVLTQDQHNELADLSVAKEAIKEFNQVKRERDDLADFKARVETTPKRKEALKRVGIDYDAQEKYGQKALDGLPADKLDDLEYVAQFVTEEGFKANIQAEQQTREPSGAEQITQFVSEAGQGTPSTEGYEQAIAAAQTPEQMDEVYRRFGKEPATT